jgi:hypothetical protein
MRKMLLAIVVGSCLAATASAQNPYQSQGRFQPLQRPQYGPGYQPLLNPYLNLLRGGNTAANYFLGTIPEQVRRENAQAFQTEITDLNVREQTLSEELPRPRSPVPTGTYALVNNTGGYFNNTSYYFGNGARPQSPIIRPGTYNQGARGAGTPARTGMSPGFAPNSTSGPR